MLALAAAGQSGEWRTITEWNFDRPGDFQGWHPNNHIGAAEVAGGNLKCTVTGRDPFLVHDVFKQPFPARHNQVIEIRMYSPAKRSCCFYWTNTLDTPYQGFSPKKYTPFEAKPGWHTYRVRPFWEGEGKIIRLRFDLPPAEEGERATYLVDYIRIIEPTGAEQPVPADFDFSRGTCGWTFDGARVRRIPGGLEISASGPLRMEAPRIELNAEAAAFVGLRMAARGAHYARLLWACAKQNGLHGAPILLNPDGRPHTYNVSPMYAGRWAGTVTYLAVEFPEQTRKTIRLSWLRCGPDPQGDPELEIRRFLVTDARPRAGRPVEIQAIVANRGGGAFEGLSATLHLPSGARLAPGESATKPLGRIDIFSAASATWRVIATRPGELRFRLSVSGRGASASASCRARFLPPVSRRYSYVPRPKPVRGDFDVGVYYFPGWWSYDRWRPIMSYPERKPALGWYREGSPEVADWHIKFAVEHGITFFAYDWYWRQGHMRLEHALHDGYFKARYRHLLKFCLLWANHFPGGKDDPQHTQEDCIRVCQYWIENYFRRPEYFRINGRPLIIIFSVHCLLQDLGEEGVRKAFDTWREMTRRAGVGEIYVAGCGWPWMLESMKRQGYDAVTGYNWPACGIGNRKWVEYSEVARNQLDLWWMAMARRKLLPILTPTSPGWDSRPWHGARALVQANRTPKAFEEHLRSAKRFALQTGQPKVIMIEAWNEFGEGSYCEPHAEYGFGHVDAIRRVFCPDAGPHDDIVPADVGLGPYDVEMPPPRRAWQFDEDSGGWQPYMGLADFAVRGGCMVARTVTNDPAFACGCNIRAGTIKAIEIRMSLKGPKSEDLAQLFWQTPLMAANEAASVKVRVTADGKFHTYRFNVSENRFWRGLITRLRFDPCTTAGTQIRIDYIRLLP